MYIRKYAGFPGLYVPDEGEIVLASRSPAGPFVRAVVTRVRRRQRDNVRVDFVWWEAVPPTTGPAYLRYPGHAVGEKGNVLLSPGGPHLIRRINHAGSSNSKSST